jgi:thiosulfate/3-mercaptopyruvate sulfurtransferase
MLQKYLLLVTGFFIFNGCAPKPTKVIETKMPQVKLQELRAEVQSGTVILDTRKPIEFYANKVPGSILVEWKDFTIKLPGAEGVLDKDPVNITRRLALWGIDQNTKVIVLGKVKDATPEEVALFGRVAWMIKEVGVKQVKTFSYELFKREVPGLNEGPPQNKSLWMPIGEAKSEILFDEFQRMIFPFNYNFKFYTLKNKDEKSGLRVGRIKNAKIHYIDVRSSEEFAKESLKSWDDSFQIHNIDWRQFYTDEGIINFNVKSTLDKLNIHESDIVIAISNQGVRSAAVAYALGELGYLDAKNFSGGYSYIKNSMELEKQINAVFFEKEKKKVRKSKSKKKSSSKKKK